MRKLMWFTIGFSAACALGAYAWGTWLIAVGVLAVLVGVLSVVLRRFWRHLRVVTAVSIGLLAGLVWVFGFDYLYLQIPRSMDGQTAQITMTASDYSYTTDYGQAVDVQLQLGGKRYNARAYYQESVSLSPGDTIRGSFRLRITVHGGNEDPTYHRGDRIYLLVYQSGEMEVTHAREVPWRFYPALWRKWLLERIDLLFPGDAAGFAKALILGERSGIDYETNTAFRVSGISHIIAVSGLHVSILFGLITLISGQNRFAVGLIGIPILLLFAAMVGFTPSVTRASVMMMLMLVGNMFDREYDPPTSLAFAALCMLAVNPMTIISVSFQLSVGCVAGIYLFSEKIRRWLLSPGRLGSGKGKGLLPGLKRWFATSVSITLGANAVTVPLVAYYFGTVSLVGVVTNLVTLWLVSWIFYGVLLACGASLLLVKAGALVAWCVSFLIRLVVGLAKALAGLPLAALYTQNVYVVLWLVFCYLLFGAFLCMRKKPAGVFAGCVVLGLCVTLLAAWVEPLLDDCRVTALDVGQGQAILLQSQGKTFLVDCGGSSSEDAADITAEHLLSQGVSRLDGIIVTHYDTDHVGGIQYLLKRLDTDALYLPVDLTKENTIAEELHEIGADRVVSVSQDMTITFKTAQILLFAPENGTFDNESSVCVLFQTEKCDILVTGDRGAFGEAQLLKHTVLPELELLIAGHHGSGDSTGTALLAATKPEYVFISVGAENRYGHPAPELLERLAEFGVLVYRTDLQGNIIFRG